MNHQKTYLLVFNLFFTSLFLAGCKKDYNVEFSIKNRSQRRLQINFQKISESRIDSNEISFNKELVFLVEMGENKSSEDYLDDLTSIPLDFLSISDLAQNNIDCEPIEIECWDKIKPRDKDGIGIVRLEVREVDFQ